MSVMLTTVASVRLLGRQLARIHELSDTEKEQVSSVPSLSLMKHHCLLLQNARMQFWIECKNRLSTSEINISAERQDGYLGRKHRQFLSLNSRYLSKKENKLSGEGTRTL